MFNNNTIAVIIAAYNAEKTIVRAVESVVDDEFVSQVIVVDDCSSDSTMQMLAGLQKQFTKVSVFSTDINSGPAKARNIALTKCTAKWVTVLDSDDYIERGRFKKLLAHSEGIELIADDKFRINEPRLFGRPWFIRMPRVNPFSGVKLFLSRASVLRRSVVLNTHFPSRSGGTIHPRTAKTYLKWAAGLTGPVTAPTPWAASPTSGTAVIWISLIFLIRTYPNVFPRSRFPIWCGMSR